MFIPITLKIFHAYPKKEEGREECRGGKLEGGVGRREGMMERLKDGRKEHINPTKTQDVVYLCLSDSLGGGPPASFPMAISPHLASSRQMKTSRATERAEDNVPPKTPMPQEKGNASCHYLGVLSLEPMEYFPVSFVVNSTYSFLFCFWTGKWRLFSE